MARALRSCVSAEAIASTSMPSRNWRVTTYRRTAQDPDELLPVSRFDGYTTDQPRELSDCHIMRAGGVHVGIKVPSLQVCRIMMAAQQC